MTKHANKKNKKSNTPKEMMTRHIQDKNDVISQEEFKDMQVGTDAEVPDVEPLDLPDDTQRPKDEEKDHTMINPWDVIK